MPRETPGGALVSKLDAEHAECRPLLSLVEAALGEMERPVWSESVPALEHSADLGQPLLSGTALERGYRRSAAQGRKVEVIAKPSRLAALFRPRRWTARRGL
jgi:hypothetical protein